MLASNAEARREAVFGALADRTRSLVLKEVAARGRATATQVAADLPVTRQAVISTFVFLTTLVSCTSSREGKEVLYEVQLQELRPRPAGSTRLRTSWSSVSHA